MALSLINSCNSSSSKRVEAVSAAERKVLLLSQEVLLRSFK
jgi:hypothetical protein